METEKHEKLKIVALRAENIKKLVAIEITPKGDVVRITGRNGQGKTSVLDSIFWALGGTDNIQAQPIRQGEKKAKIELDLGDLVVKRTFTEKGTTLVIENKQGMQFKSPQTMLDNLIGRLSFDPLEFMRQDAKKQFETLKALTGVDLSALDLKRAELFAERTNVNRNVKALEARYGALVVPADAPKVETASSDILAKINEATEVQRLKDSAATKKTTIENQVASNRATVAGRIHDMQKRADEMRTQIKHLQESIAETEAKVKEVQEQEVTWIEAQEASIVALDPVIAQPLPHDIAALQIELKNLEDSNKAARAYQDKEKLRQELSLANTEATALSGAIDQIDGEKAAKISEAKFPLPDLTFGEGVVIYKGLPLDQASSAEQLRVSMAMAMALNPKLRVIRITDGSLLDTTSMKVVEEMAHTGDFQVWIEQVDESGKIGIVIEDGHVVAVNEPEATTA